MSFHNSKQIIHSDIASHSTNIERLTRQPQGYKDDGIHAIGVHDKYITTSPNVKTMTPVAMDQIQFGTSFNEFKFDKGDFLHGILIEVVLPGLRFKNEEQLLPGCKAMYAEKTIYALIKKFVIRESYNELITYDSQSFNIIYNFLYDSDMKDIEDKYITIKDTLKKTTDGMIELKPNNVVLRMLIKLPDAFPLHLLKTPLYGTLEVAKFEDIILLEYANQSSTEQKNLRNPLISDIVDLNGKVPSIVSSMVGVYITNVTEAEKNMNMSIGPVFYSSYQFKPNTDAQIHINTRETSPTGVFDFIPENLSPLYIITFFQNTTERNLNRGNEIFNYSTISPKHAGDNTSAYNTTACTSLHKGLRSDTIGGGRDDSIHIKECGLHEPRDIGMSFLPLDLYNLHPDSKIKPTTALPTDQLKIVKHYSESMRMAVDEYPRKPDGSPLVTPNADGKQIIHPQMFHYKSYYCYYKILKIEDGKISPYRDEDYTAYINFRDRSKNVTNEMS